MSYPCGQHNASRTSTSSPQSIRMISLLVLLECRSRVETMAMFYIALELQGWCIAFIEYWKRRGHLFLKHRVEMHPRDMHRLRSLQQDEKEEDLYWFPGYELEFVTWFSISIGRCPFRRGVCRFGEAHEDIVFEGRCLRKGGALVTNIDFISLAAVLLPQAVKVDVVSSTFPMVHVRIDCLNVMVFHLRIGTSM